MAPEVREFRKLTLTELQGYISEVKTMTFRELCRSVKRKNVPALQAWIHSIAHQGIILGDDKRFDTLMDRVVGRVADQLNIKATLEKEIKSKTQAELVDEAKRLLAELEAVKR